MADDFASDITTTGLLPADGKFTSTLDGAGDSDWYRITLEVGKYYYVTVAAGTARHAGLVLRDKNGAVLQSGMGSGSSDVLSYRATASGDCYVEVNNRTGQEGTQPYTLRTLSGIDAVGDDTATARPVALGETVGSRYEGGTDVDVYAIALKAGVTYTMSTDYQYGKMGFIGPANAYVGQGQLDGAQNISITPGTDSTWYIKTQQRIPYAPPVDYSLTVTAAPDDANAGAAGALQVAPGSIVRGHLGNAADMDCFAISVAAGTRYWIKLLGAEHTAALLDVFTASKGIAGLTRGQTVIPTAGEGTIYMRMSDEKGGTGDYRFAVMALTADGTGGNDHILADGANLRLNGGAGLDTVIYQDASTSMVVEHGGGKTLVARLGGQTYDALSGIERLMFSDTNIAFDFDGAGGQAYRMYRAALNRAPDKEGLGYWLYQLDQGAQLTDVAASFITSAEFEGLYGAASGDAAFVRNLYANVLHRAPDQSGLDYWVNGLHNGAGRAAVLAGFSESAENQAAALQLIGNGFAYTPYG